MVKLSASSLLGLPSFLFAVTVFYWSLPIFGFVHRIHFLKLRGRRNDTYDWAKSMVAFFRITILQYGSNTLHKQGQILYLSNHRSWADFFLDNYLTEGRAALMSRWMVFFAFPVFCTAVIILRGILLFKRGTIMDKEKFNRWLDESRASSPVPGFLVYPEGHRNIKPSSLPLKRGMLAYAHSRKLPVQLIITAGKEQVLNEKTMSIRFGVRLVTGYSKVIDSSACGSYEEFVKEVQVAWDALWGEVYGADPTKLPPLSTDNVHSYEYPPSMKALMLLATLASMVLFLAAAAATWKALAAVLAAAGHAQALVVSCAAAWIAASTWASGLLVA